MFRDPDDVVKDVAKRSAELKRISQDVRRIIPSHKGAAGDQKEMLKVIQKAISETDADFCGLLLL